MRQITAQEVLCIATALKAVLNSAFWETDLTFTVCLSTANWNTSRSSHMAFSPLVLDFFLLDTLEALAVKSVSQSSASYLRKKSTQKKIHLKEKTVSNHWV